MYCTSSKKKESCGESENPATLLFKKSGQGRIPTAWKNGAVSLNKIK